MFRTHLASTSTRGSGWSGCASTRRRQTQALDRTQPSLPLKPGRAGTMIHDYKPNGTVNVFAALNAATGEVLTHCCRRHTHNDFLFFLKLIELHVPRGLEVHIVLDNLAVHTPPRRRALAGPPKAQGLPASLRSGDSSWLNLVERWF